MMPKRFLIFISIFILPLSVLLAQDTSDNEALYAAKKSFEDGFYDIALNLFDRHLELFPQSVLADEVNLYIGRCYLQKKSYNQAIERFNSLLSGLKDDNDLKDDVYYWLAEAFFKNNDFEQANLYYERLLSGYPGSSYALAAEYSSGWCLFEQGRFEEAKKKFSDFKVKYPNDILAEEAGLKIAECLYNLRDYPGLKAYLRLPERSSWEDGKKVMMGFYLAESCFYTGDYPCAIENYNQAIETASEESLKKAIRLGLGWSYLKSGDYPRARDNFELLLKENLQGIEDENTLLGYALSLAANAQHREALAVYEKLAASSKEQSLRIEAYIGRAEALHNLGDYPAAISSYQEAMNIKKEEINPEALCRLRYGLGLSYFKAGENESARQEFRFIIDNSKDAKYQAWGRLKLAEILLQEGDCEKALGEHQRVLSEYPDASVGDYAAYGAAMDLICLKRYPEAASGFKKALNDYPKSSLRENAAFYLGKSYYEAGDFLNSYLQLRSFKGEYPASALRPEALFTEAKSLKSLGRLQEAYAAFKELSQSYRNDSNFSSRAELEIADILEAMGDKEAALEKLESLRSKYPDSPGSGLVLWRLAGYYFESGKLDLAKRYLLDIIKNSREDSLVYDASFLLGVCLEQEENYADALEMFKKAQGRRQGAYLKIARIYKDLSRFQEAADYYRLSLDKEPGSSPDEARLGLAECLEELGSLDEALSEYALLARSNQPLEFQVKALLRLANIYEQQGNRIASIAAYERLARLDVPEAGFAREKIQEETSFQGKKRK